MKIAKEDGLEGSTPGSDSYEVGYRKPPKKSQFKKGVSGNPAGRPRGSKNKPRRFGAEKLKEIVLTEAYRDIEVRDGNEMITVPMAEAVIRATAVKAAKGYIGSARLFTEMLNEVEAQERALKDEHFQVFLKYKLDAECELKERERLGVTDGEMILPHPDDVIVDPRTGEACIAGPMTQEEWDEWATFARQKAELPELRSDIEKRMEQARSKERKESLRKTLGKIDRRQKLLDQAIPNSWIEREKKHWTSG